MGQVSASLHAHPAMAPLAPSPGFWAQPKAPLSAPLALCDPSAALALAQKPWLGRTNTLRWRRRGYNSAYGLETQSNKVGTNNNLSACLTKDVPRDVLERHVGAMGSQTRGTGGDLVTSTWVAARGGGQGRTGLGRRIRCGL